MLMCFCVWLIPCNIILNLVPLGPLLWGAIPLPHLCLNVTTDWNANERLSL